jgi:hypothetical protein
MQVISVKSAAFAPVRVKTGISCVATRTAGTSPKTGAPTTNTRHEDWCKTGARAAMRNLEALIGGVVASLVC